MSVCVCACACVCACVSVGWNKNCPPDLVYYCLFTFFSLVAFFCAAGHAHGSGNAAASAFFAVLLTGTTGAAALLTYKEAADEALMSEGPMLNPGQPASMSGPSNLPPNF